MYKLLTVPVLCAAWCLGLTTAALAEEQDGVAVQDTQTSPMVYEQDLSKGIDGALLAAFRQARLSVSSEQGKDEALADAVAALKNVEINGDLLKVEFDSKKVSDFVKSTGALVWGGSSDKVVAWLVNIGDDSSQLLGGSERDLFSTQLSNAAKIEHFSLTFPLLDLDDVQLVTPAKVLARSEQDLVKASARYGAAYILTGGEESDGDGALIFKWNLYTAQGAHLGRGEAVGQGAQAAAKSASEIARILAAQQESATLQQNVVSAGSGNGGFVLGPNRGYVRVKLNGVQDLADLSRIRAALVTYGYESSFRVAGYSDGGLIVDIPSGSTATILDGTLTHAAEFTREDNWVYRFNDSNGTQAGPVSGTVGPRRAGSAFVSAPSVTVSRVSE
ncbi:MAG: DUF2066 domain-containing protein [Succinivibrio sp.]|nr:DUF2066 domain-containing protein [Succinivibrio sp.]